MSNEKLSGRSSMIGPIFWRMMDSYLYWLAGAGGIYTTAWLFHHYLQFKIG